MYDDLSLEYVIAAARGIKPLGVNDMTAKKTFWIKEVRQSYKLLSVQAMSLNIAVLTTYSALPDKLQDAIPVSGVIGLAIGLLVLGIIGRLKSQSGKR